jgi:hypothetical protein
MAVILDEATRRRLPGAANFFMNPPYPLSACFDSAGTGERQKVHINPHQAVKLVQDKGRLYQTLDRKGMPMGNFRPMEDIVSGRTFDVPKYERQFPIEKGPVQVISKAKQGEIADLEELLDFLKNTAKHEGAVFKQSKLEVPTTAMVATIPAMDGKALNNGATNIMNGILGHNIPKATPNQADLLAASRQAVHNTGLDYGIAFIQFDGKGDFEIMDVQSQLRRQDAIALRAFADYMQRQNGAKKK